MWPRWHLDADRIASAHRTAGNDDGHHPSSTNQLTVDEVNLSKIRLRRILTNTRQMLNGRPEMGIPFDAATLDQ